MKESNSDPVTPSLEAQVTSELRALLAGLPAGAEFTVTPSADLCYSLELFLPQLLRCRHPEWTKESLDGVFVALARKTAPAAVQIAGTCILISDQTVTPFLVDLALSSSGESLESFRVCIGEPGGGALGISGPECNSREAKELLATLTTRLNSIPWSYKIASNEN